MYKVGDTVKLKQRTLQQFDFYLNYPFYIVDYKESNTFSCRVNFYVGEEGYGYKYFGFTLDEIFHSKVLLIECMSKSCVKLINYV